MLSVEEGEVAPIETATPMEDVAPAPSASATKAVATDGEEFDPENLDASYGRPEALRGGLTRTLKQVLEECTWVLWRSGPTHGEIRVTYASPFRGKPKFRDCCPQLPVALYAGSGRTESEN